MPKIHKEPEPDPKTGMRNMAISIAPGDRVVLIRGEDHEVVSDPTIADAACSNLQFKVPWKAANRDSLGWGILDRHGRITYWKWIEGAAEINWDDIIEVTLDVATCDPLIRGGQRQ